MEPQEQGDRYQPASDDDAGTAEARRGARDRSANPTARALIDDFASAARVWAQRLKVSPNRFFQLDDMHGKSIHWMRERYFGGVVPSLDDVEWIRLKAHGPKAIKEISRSDVRNYRLAIEAMCRLCVGADDETKAPKCWDATCPLRSVSPLPLSDSALTKDPLRADDVG